MRTASWVKGRKYPAFNPAYIEQLMKEATQSVQPPPAPPDIERLRADWRRAFWQRAPGTARLIAGQNDRGYWVGQATWKDRAMQCASTVTYRNVPKMLNELHRLAAAEGRVPPDAVASKHFALRAWPVPDLYDTPLRPRKQAP